jgi:hypothetical protein
MNRTLKEATVKRFYYETQNDFRQHLNFVNAYNFARRLKTRKRPTPCEYLCGLWTKEAQRFQLNPTRLTGGPNISRQRRKQVHSGLKREGDRIT